MRGYGPVTQAVCVVLQHLWPDLEEKLSTALLSLELELRKAAEIAGLTHIAQALEEVGDAQRSADSGPALPSHDAQCSVCSVMMPSVKSAVS